MPLPVCHKRRRTDSCTFGMSGLPVMNYPCRDDFELHRSISLNRAIPSDLFVLSGPVSDIRRTRRSADICRATWAGHYRGLPMWSLMHARGTVLRQPHQPCQILPRASTPRSASCSGRGTQFAERFARHPSRKAGTREYLPRARACRLCGMDARIRQSRNESASAGSAQLVTLGSFPRPSM